MAITPKQRARIDELTERASRYGEEGIFTPGSGGGMNPEDAAWWAWEEGYIPVPTVQALLDELEKNLEKNKKGSDPK